MNLHKLFLTKNERYMRGGKMKVVGGFLHSTGANNKKLNRYVGPDDGLLGPNPYGNHWNVYHPGGKDIGPHTYVNKNGDGLCDVCGGRQVAVHAFIGLLADGTVASYQTLPWDMPGWHSGKGSKGSANNMGYFGVEICEDGLDDPVYFGKVYREAVELFAHAFKLHSLDPMKDGAILDHSEGHKRGIASNHGDVMHWFRKHGKDMDDFRADVAAEMKKPITNTNKEKGDEPMTGKEILDALTDEQAYQLLTKARRHAKLIPEQDWSREEGHWQKATDNEIVDGTSPEGPITRAENIAILGRLGLLEGH